MKNCLLPAARCLLLWQAYKNSLHFRPMNKRYVMAVPLDGSFKKKLDGLHNQYGMTQMVMMSLLVEFLAAQKPTTQAAILSNSSDKDRANTAKRILEDMAGKG